MSIEVGPAGSGRSHAAGPLAGAPSALASSVRDTGIGIGIAKEYEQRIFEAFVQGAGRRPASAGDGPRPVDQPRARRAARRRDHDGLDARRRQPVHRLLPLSRPASSTPAFTANTVPAMEPGSHSVPRSLPAPVPVTRAPIAPPPAHDLTAFDGVRFLVVDDDYRNIFAPTALCERGRAVVSVAESGPDAVASLERTPDIYMVLMDITMPGVDGYAAMRAIRAIDRFADLTIIAVTGKVVAGERERCIDAGANHYMPRIASAASPRAWTATRPSRSTETRCCRSSPVPSS